MAGPLTWALTLFLIVACLATFSPAPARAADVKSPAPKSSPSQPQPNNFLVICVLIVAAIVLTMGGCEANKLIKKIPPRNGDDDDPPPPPPTSTNAPSQHVVNSFTVAPHSLLSVPVDDNNAGIIRWDLTQSATVAANPGAYTDPNTGQMYTDLLTTSIQGKPSLESTNWVVVGSRIIWLSENSSALICWYDGHGNPVLTNYVRAGDPEWVASPDNTNSVSTSVPLMDWEIGTNHFFRLVEVTNHMGILTQP